MSVIAGATDELILNDPVKAPVFIEPGNNALNFAHHFRANAVTGNNENISAHGATKPLNLLAFLVLKGPSPLNPISSAEGPMPH